MTRTLIAMAALCAAMGCRSGDTAPPHRPAGTPREAQGRLSPPAAGGGPRDGDGPVVASKDDDRVTLVELQAFLDGFDPARQAEVAPAEGRRGFLRNYLLYRAALRRAEAAGYGDDPRVRRARDRAMAQAWTEDRVSGHQAPPLSDAALRARWEQIKRPARPARVRARHIRVADLAAAEALRGELLDAIARPGADAEAIFAAAAERQSLDDRTRERGGDLLFFSRGGDEVAWRLAPRSVLEAALATHVTGQVSLPLEGPEGVHLVMVTDRRDATQQTFEDAADALRETMAREQAGLARDAVEAELLDMNDWTVDDGALDGLVVAPTLE